MVTPGNYYELISSVGSSTHLLLNYPKIKAAFRAKPIHSVRKYVLRSTLPIHRQVVNFPTNNNITSLTYHLKSLYTINNDNKTVSDT